MSQPLSSFQKFQVINTFKKVNSIRETSMLCRASRNTVRKVLRSMGLPVETQNKMRIHGANSKALRKLPPMNKKSDWNPLSSNLYKSLREYQDCKKVEPWVVENLNNMALLMNSLAVELRIGNSIIGTLKMELLMRSYMSFCDSEARAAALSTELTLSADKQAKAHLMYKEAGNKALKTMFSILGELEGTKSELRNVNLHQNNINISMKDETTLV